MFAAVAVLTLPSKVFPTRLGVLAASAVITLTFTVVAASGPLAPQGWATYVLHLTPILWFVPAPIIVYGCAGPPGTSATNAPSAPSGPAPSVAPPAAAREGRLNPMAPARTKDAKVPVRWGPAVLQCFGRPACRCWPCSRSAAAAAQGEAVPARLAALVVAAGSIPGRRTRGGRWTCPRQAGPSCYLGHSPRGDRLAETAAQPQQPALVGAASTVLPDVPDFAGRIGGLRAIARSASLLAAAQRHGRRSPHADVRVLSDTVLLAAISVCPALDAARRANSRARATDGGCPGGLAWPLPAVDDGVVPRGGDMDILERDGLAVYRRGRGPQVLVPPYPHASTHRPMAEDRLADVLVAAGFAVVSFDPPGAYRSTRPMTGDMAEMTDCCVEALEVAGVHPPVLIVGHSMSSLCALGLAVEQPRLIARLVLVGSLSGFPAARRWSFPHNWSPWHDPEWWQCMWWGTRQMLGLGNLATYRHLDNLTERASVVDPAMAEPFTIAPGDRRRPQPPRAIWLQTVRTVDYRQRLAEVRAPTLVVIGRHDPQTPMPCARELVAGIPGSRLVIFERSGHAPFIEEPDTFTAGVTAFLLER